MTNRLVVPKGYTALLKDLKQRIRVAQVHASIAVNQELVFSIGALAETSWPGRSSTDGERKSSTAWLPICDWRFPRSAASPHGISSTCGLSLKPGPMSHLCKRRLHKLAGTTTLLSSKNLNPRSGGFGTPVRLSKTDGVATCWCTRSKVIF